MDTSLSHKKSRSLLDLILAQPKQKGGARARAPLRDSWCWSEQCHGTDGDSASLALVGSVLVALSGGGTRCGCDFLPVCRISSGRQLRMAVNPVLREGGKRRCISCSGKSKQTQPVNVLKHRNSVNIINSRRGFFRQMPRTFILWNLCCNVYNHKRGERDKKDF